MKTQKLLEKSKIHSKLNQIHNFGFGFDTIWNTMIMNTGATVTQIKLNFSGRKMFRKI